MSQDTFQELQQDYYESLGDLTFNSRPLIATLTMVAQETEVKYAEAIVRAVEMRITKVSRNIELLKNEIYI